MPTCDDHYQSVPNTITKPKPKRDRGDRTAVTFSARTASSYSPSTTDRESPLWLLHRLTSRPVARARRSRIYLATVCDEPSGGAPSRRPLHPLSHPSLVEIPWHPCSVRAPLSRAPPLAPQAFGSGARSACASAAGAHGPADVRARAQAQAQAQAQAHAGSGSVTA